MNLTSSKQKQAVYHLITYVMMSSGRLTVNKGNYWRKTASFINISDADKSSAMSANVNDSLSVINELSEENKAGVFAMVVNMAVADGTAQENVATLVQKIAFALQIPLILKKLGPDRYKSIEERYAL